MQFTNGGPSVPNSLLQAHEEGRVVLFAGAGISFNVGLPGFEQLVKALISSLGYVPPAVVESALIQKRYDTAIDLLETTHWKTTCSAICIVEKPAARFFATGLAQYTQIFAYLSKHVENTMPLSNDQF